MAVVLAGSEHVPPLSASVIVTVCEAPVAVSAQLLKPLVGMIVGVAGTVKTEVAFGNDDRDRVAGAQRAGRASR